MGLCALVRPPQVMPAGTVSANQGVPAIGVAYLAGALKDAGHDVVVVDALASAQIPSINTAEYFWNTDPGPGNGTPLLAFDGNYNEALEQAVANNLSFTHVM